MDDLYSGFCELFDKGKGRNSSEGQWLISESDNKASLQSVSIQGGEKVFYTLNQDAYKGLLGKMLSQSTHLKDLDCDGVALVEDGSPATLVLVELKSSLCTTYICRAYEQLLYTHIKLQMMFSLCEGVPLTERRVVYWIICGEDNGENGVSSRKHRDFFENLISKQCSKENDLVLNPMNKFSRDLYKWRHLKITLGNNHIIRDKPFSSEIKSLEVQIYLSLVDTTNRKDVTLPFPEELMR